MPADIVHTYNAWLKIPSWIYGFFVRARNLLYDAGILKSRSFPVPVISVGNLAVGGTGKTPLIEYLIRLLSPHYRVAVLSRGYKRASTGFVRASVKSTAQTIGDESYQIWHKFPKIIVAVDADRCHGIRRLLSLPKDQCPEVILLDDAFQHRRVKPSLSIVLTDSHRPYYHDRLLPMGRLREPISGISRADAVIVTRCDEDLQPIDYRILQKGLDLRPHQHCFFSSVCYDDLKPVFREAPRMSIRKLNPQTDAMLMMAGIAAPQYFFEEGRKYSDNIRTIAFPDHHSFNHKDVSRLIALYNGIRAKRKIVVCTEKDAARLVHSSHISPAIRRVMYYWPVTITFHEEDPKRFDRFLLDHIQSITQHSSNITHD